MPYIFTDYGQMTGKRPRQVYFKELEDAVNDLDTKLNSSQVNVIQYKPATDAITTYPGGITAFEVSEAQSTGYPQVSGVVETAYFDDHHNIQFFYDNPTAADDPSRVYYRKWYPQQVEWSTWKTIATIEDISGQTSALVNGITFTYLQDALSNTWIITHNLKRYPAVTTVDTNGNVIYGDVSYQSDNELTIQFTTPVAGAVYLN